jgi:hypothetical protein
VAEARHIVVAVAVAARRSYRHDCRRGTAVPDSTTWRIGRLVWSGVEQGGCTRVQKTEPRMIAVCAVKLVEAQEEESRVRRKRSAASGR